MTISKAQYLGTYAKSKDLTAERLANIDRLLTKVNHLMMIAMQDGVVFLDNPKTKSQVAGEKNGGFRPQDCLIGAPKSAHKEGLACDLYDPTGKIDKWLNTSKVAAKAIADLDMYFEAESSTIGWSHWSIKPPASKRRFFIP